MSLSPRWLHPLRWLRAAGTAVWPPLSSPHFPHVRRTRALMALGACLGLGWSTVRARQQLARLSPPPLLPVAKRPVVVARGDLMHRPNNAVMAPTACGEAAIAHFLTRPTDALRALQGFLGGTWRIDAYTIPGADTLFVTRPLRSLSDTTFAHEWTHLIQDQYLDLRARYAARATWDEKLALTATVEAVAHLVADDGAWAHVSPYTDNWETNATALVHEVAPRWVKRTWSDYPLATTAAAPSSTYAILFPADATPSVPPLAVAPTGTCHDRLGPLAVMTAVYRLTRDPALTDRAGRLWRGDVVEQRAADPTRLRWTVQWDPAHAETLDAVWRRIAPDTGVVVAGAATPAP